MNNIVAGKPHRRVVLAGCLHDAPGALGWGAVAPGYLNARNKRAGRRARARVCPMPVIASHATLAAHRSDPGRIYHLVDLTSCQEAGSIWLVESEAQPDSAAGNGELKPTSAEHKRCLSRLATEPRSILLIACGHL